MSNRASRRIVARRPGWQAKYVAEQEKVNATMDVLGAILHAYGEGPDKRLAVAAAYLDQPRRPVVVDGLEGGRIVVRFETQQKEPE